MTFNPEWLEYLNTLNTEVHTGTMRFSRADGDLVRLELWTDDGNGVYPHIDMWFKDPPPMYADEEAP